MNQAGTIWAVLAICLFVAEMFTGTVYLLVMALAFLGAAVVAFWGANLTLSVLVAAVLSVMGITYVYRLRRKRSQMVQTSQDNDLDLGEQVVIREVLSDTRWRVFYCGANWEAKSTSSYVFQAGDNARICGKDGIVLLIEPI
ncbi:MAG: NfeD family protein [Alysiella sp.]|uniref:NfeD family protein n=1 Tax=Alysiella sp. TaxID=1872483 RepID=UPI0026DCDFD2|nr:NfeD family protein [Alysiella sp.]MDO4433408.1 NfeD family protein [Alysiella sp.]